MANSYCLNSQSGSYPAAEYCNTYKPVSSGKGSSGWYLPAAGELYVTSFSYGAINLGLQKLSKTQFNKTPISTADFYSSSSEYLNDYEIWSVNVYSGGMVHIEKSLNRRVRCVLAF